jgi:K+-transporting ATPase c subunit
MHILILASLLSFSAHAFTIVGGTSDGSALKGWDKTKLSFPLNSSGCSVGDAALRAAIDDALATWNGVQSARLTLELGGDTTTTAAQATALTASDGNVPIACFTAAAGGVDPDVVLGYSNYTYNTATRHFIQSYVVLNSVSGEDANINTQSAGALAATIAHEMGHSVGLGHTADINALMYYSSYRTLARLSQDDADGYTFLYPRSELTGGGFMGCGTLAAVGVGTALSGKKNDRGGPPPAGGAAAISLFAIFALCFVGARVIGRLGRQSEALTSAT